MTITLGRWLCSGNMVTKTDRESRPVRTPKHCGIAANRRGMKESHPHPAFGHLSLSGRRLNCSLGALIRRLWKTQGFLTDLPSPVQLPIEHIRLLPERKGGRRPDESRSTVPVHSNAQGLGTRSPLPPNAAKSCSQSEAGTRNTGEEPGLRVRASGRREDFGWREGV